MEANLSIQEVIGILGAKLAERELENTVLRMQNAQLTERLKAFEPPKEQKLEVVQ